MKKVLLLASLLLAACSLPPVEELPVPFTTLAMGEYGHIHQAKNVVVRNDREWQDLWRVCGETQKPPQIDFDRDMVIAVFLGPRPTAGYGVRITEARKTPDALQVFVAERKPDEKAVLAQVLTYPYVVIKLPKDDRPVRFEFRN